MTLLVDSDFFKSEQLRKKDTFREIQCGDSFSQPDQGLRDKAFQKTHPSMVTFVEYEMNLIHVFGMSNARNM